MEKVSVKVKAFLFCTSFPFYTLQSQHIAPKKTNFAHRLLRSQYIQNLTDSVTYVQRGH